MINHYFLMFNCLFHLITFILFLIYKKSLQLQRLHLNLQRLIEIHLG